MTLFHSSILGAFDAIGRYIYTTTTLFPWFFSKTFWWEFHFNQELGHWTTWHIKVCLLKDISIRDWTTWQWQQVFKVGLLDVIFNQNLDFGRPEHPTCPKMGSGMSRVWIDFLWDWLNFIDGWVIFCFFMKLWFKSSRYWASLLLLFLQVSNCLDFYFSSMSDLRVRQNHLCSWCSNRWSTSL